MFTVGRKVSFSVVIALLVGWGIFALLFMQASATLLQAQAYETDRPIPLPAGVKLNLQVDKKVYKASETILIALRNDSRLTIWLAEHADGCFGSWWQVEVLGPDGETWSPMALSPDPCSTSTQGVSRFTRHSIQTAEWVTIVPSNERRSIVVPVSVGTYRIVAPYLKGGQVQESSWDIVPRRTVVSPSFTIQ